MSRDIHTASSGALRKRKPVSGNRPLARCVFVYSCEFFRFLFCLFHTGCFYFGLIPRGLFLCIRLECMFPSLLSIGFSFAGFCHLACAPRALLYFLVSCDVREVVWRPLATSCFVTIGYDFYFSISVFFLASRRFCLRSNQIVYSGY